MVEGSGLLKKGYSFVMVDLRRFGGSNGCLDWSGRGEQADVVNAVKWAASRPWSTGSVGMYGKSYDALTGLVGVDHHPTAWTPCVPGAGLRRLPLPLRRRHVARELARQPFKAIPASSWPATCKDSVAVPADELTGSETDFTLPPALQDRPAGSVYIEPVGG